MKIYLSSLTMNILLELEKRIPNKKPNVLLSFGVRKNDDMLFMEKKRDAVNSLILDSGTFSLHFANGVTEEDVNLQSYIHYLNLCSDKFDFYFNFDGNFTIHGFEDNLYYLKELEEKGFTPVPVIHDYYREEIDYYIDNGYKLVALGSVMEKGAMKFLRNDFDIKYAVDRLIKHAVKIHLFAAASYPQLCDLPLYSSDASSWAQHAAMGKIVYWNKNKDGDDKTDIIRFFDRPGLKPDGNYFFQEYPFIKELEEHLDSMGLTYEDLMGFAHNQNRAVVNAAYYMQIEDILTQRYKEKGFPF